MLRCIRAAFVGVLLVLTVTGSAWGAARTDAEGAAVRPQPPAERGFRLIGRARYAFRVNRPQCGMDNQGHMCLDPGFHNPGASWPKDTPNSYLFNSGPSVAGIIGPEGGPWAGDTAGGFLFDPKGTTEHGAEVDGLITAVDPEDRVQWPAEARVPSQGPFAPGLRGQVGASEGDAWWLMWEGNPGLSIGRSHPLGILVEGRVLAWNYPAGNDDIIYVRYTFYNITSLDPAAYVGVRPELRPTLLAQAERFHALNNEHFGITLPPAGYTVSRFTAGVIADPDVASAGGNYTSVNHPLAMGFAWERTFRRTPGWSFDAGIHTQPFFAGSGLVGIKVVEAPAGPPTLQLFTDFTGGGGGLGVPLSVSQLFRYLTGGFTPALGDAVCPYSPALDRICFIRSSGPGDVRSMASVPETSLAPGGSASLTVAYVFAAPVRVGGCGPAAVCDVRPGDPLRMNNPGQLASGANLADSVAGFRGWADDNANGVVDGFELRTVSRSLYGKAQQAQALFDNGFLLPSAPEAPEFFLVPGDNAVTVLWRPSPSETTGDPYFALAQGATMVPAGGGAPVPNPLYDPNFRQFDVEGYRVYRSRVEDPAAMTLLAQFDYAGTAISDYSGLVNPQEQCAPELGVRSGCAVAFDSVGPGQSKLVHQDVPLSFTVVQTREGDRFLLPDGQAFTLRADSTTPACGVPSYEFCLQDSGVPFVYTDSTVRNGFRYFYSVVAFDVNSLTSGPSSQESPRLLKPVTPTTPAANRELASGAVTIELVGRGRVLDPTLPLPALDATTGRFSGPFPPSNGWGLGLISFVAELLDGPGETTVRLDSIGLGSPYTNQPHTYWLTASNGALRAQLSIPILQRQEVGVTWGQRDVAVIPANPGLAARFGGGAGYAFQARLSLNLTGPDYASLYGRGCVNGRPGFGSSRECAYNGSRWFQGPSPSRNETRVHPIGGNQANFSGTPMTNYNNAGELPGVRVIHNTQAYQSVGGAEYRPVEGFKAGAHRAADFNLYWGANGRVDSVIDVTHNVAVPFEANRLGGGWGILNPGAAQPAAGSYDQRAELTSTDFGCIEPLRGIATTISCGAAGPTYALSQTAVPGPVVFFSPTLAAARTEAPAAEAGFGLWIAGDIFTFQLVGGQLPANGAVWSLRQYIGAIAGGQGDGGNYGPYQFSAPETVFLSNSRFLPLLPFTAVGAELRLRYDVVNHLRPTTGSDLARVHPVPDPYYLRSGFDETEQQEIHFINVPEWATIRIYTSSGILVALLEHRTGANGGDLVWNVRNRDGRRVASGVYFYHVEAGGARRIGRMTIVNPRR